LRECGTCYKHAKHCQKTSNPGSIDWVHSAAKYNKRCILSGTLAKRKRESAKQ
jgi:hypothetical protein